MDTTAVLRLLIPVCLLSAGTMAADDDWPRWRGPNNDGMARGDVPVSWTERDVKWKADIPGRGHSSPVIWGDTIFVTTAVPAASAMKQAVAPAETAGSRRGAPGGASGPQPEHDFLLIAINRNTGKTHWTRKALTAQPHEGYHSTYGSYASNSPVTDGKHVFAFFGSRGIYCYDLKGNLIWKKDPGIRMHMRMNFGEGVAPALDGDTLLLTYDQESDSSLLALNKNNGEELWRVKRDEISNWAQPLVISYKGSKQVVVAAPKKVRSYDLKTGKLIWECAGLGANTIPTPIQHGDIVIVMSGFRDPNLLAIRLGREGDLTGTDAIVWTNQRGNSYTPSPVLHDGKLYVLTDNGMLSCFNASTGEAYYRQTRLPKPYNFKASPVGVAGKLYLSSEDGDVIVVKMGETFEVLATNTMKDQFFVATPAVAEGEIYLRGQNTLFCISGKTQETDRATTRSEAVPIARR